MTRASSFQTSGATDYPQALLEIHVVSPEGARLPFTEKGYGALLLPPRLIEQAGGPAAYVGAWLDEAASSRA